MIGISAGSGRSAAVAAVAAVLVIAAANVPRAYSQAGTPNYAALLATPDRSEADRGPISVAIRCRFLNSPDCVPG